MIEKKPYVPQDLDEFDAMIEEKKRKNPSYFSTDHKAVFDARLAEIKKANGVS